MLACYHLVSIDKSLGDVGLTIANSDHRIADTKRKLGVLVHSLDHTGTGYAQGLRTGDVIMAVNDQVVSTHQEAVTAVDAIEKFVVLKVWGLRASRELQLYKSSGKIGITLCDNERGPGVLVCELGEGQQALRMGLRVGDVLLAVNGVIVTHHSLAVAAIDEAAEEVAFVYVPAAAGDTPEVAMREMEA